MIVLSYRRPSFSCWGIFEYWSLFSGRNSSPWRRSTRVWGLFGTKLIVGSFLWSWSLRTCIELDRVCVIRQDLIEKSLLHFCRYCFLFVVYLKLTELVLNCHWENAGMVDQNIEEENCLLIVDNFHLKVVLMMIYLNFVEFWYDFCLALHCPLLIHFFLISMGNEVPGFSSN